jgi:mRNA-degrading endonuclease toxin of MazEF toxin-antitoxin module
VSEHKQRDIWLTASARHAAGGERHVRPVLIISNDRYNDENDEIICLHLTTDVRHGHAVPLDLQKDMKMNRLVDESAVRYDAVSRYPKAIMLKKLGKIRAEKLATILSKLSGLLH